jgi:MFS family permease
MGGVLLMASSNTLIQTLVDDDKRGRVMSIFSMAFTGTMPAGNLLVGFLAAEWGTTVTLTASGVICIIIAGLFYRSIPRLRAAAAPVLAKLVDPAVFEPIVHPAIERKDG